MKRLVVGIFLTAAGFYAPAQYPHSAEILNVSGRWTGSQAEVVWETGSEYGTAGFRVFRQDSGGEVPLPSGLIPADITRPAGSYAAVDADQTQGSEASYRIEEIRGDGTIRTLGVWTVTFEKPAPAVFVRLAVEDPVFIPMSAPDPVPAPAAKLLIASNDVYAVTYEALGAVLGLTQGDTADRAAEASLVMRRGNDPVSYWADDAGQRLLFYGWQAKSRYTQYNVFWIEPGTAGDGLLMERLTPDGDPVSPDQTFAGLADFEKDLVSMVEHSGVLRDDLYFWTHVQVNTGSPQMERTFDAPLEGYAGGDVDVTVRLTGWNDTPADPDHSVEVRFNDTLIGAFTFNGKADIQKTFTAAADTVLENGNQIKIRGVLLPGLLSSIFVVQGYSLEYLQDYGLRDGPLEASDGGHERLSADGFTDAFVLNVTDPHHPVLAADAGGVLPEGAGWPAGADTRWIYRERAAIPEAAPMPAGHGGWLRAVSNAVDYLVIAPRAFEEPAHALADYRAGQGLRTAVAYYEDICDQFADGLNTPEAIRNLLIYARENWAAAPWMAVPGGWGHYDYYGVQTAAVNHLPPLLGSDSETLRPADGLFADLTGNEIPDLAIGRIPAQNVTQFNQYIAKLQAYESNGFESWHQNAFFVADNADDGGDFTATNLEAAQKASGRYTTAHTTLDSSTVAQVRADIRAAFTNGTGVIHYTGHGTYRQLANENLLDYNTVTAMENPSLPLFISLTCLLARFDMYLPDLRSMGEALVLQPEGGALAVYAPSGLALNHYAKLFSNELYRLHAEEEADTIGLLVRRARESFGELIGLHATSIRTYNLLGDPALKLRGGEGGTPPWWNPSFASWRWERFSYADLEQVGSVPDKELFEEYVLGSLPSGLRLTQSVEEDTGRAVVGWNQRGLVTDLDYRLMVSTNLLTGLWQEPPPDMETVKSEGSDPSLENAEARFSLDSDQIFVRLEVFMKKE